MFLSSDDIQEIRIFRSRLIRVMEHGICPNHLSQELTQVVNETITVRSGKMEFYNIERSRMPMVRYLLDNDVDFEMEKLLDKHDFNIMKLKRMIEIFGKV